MITIKYSIISIIKIVSIPEYSSDFGKYYEELAEQIEDGFNHRYFRLPTKRDIHEYRIMERFINNLPAGTVQEELEQAIRGRGAFHRFKSIIRYHGLEQDWYSYRDNAFRNIAIEWCEANGFEYYEDDPNLNQE